jgi:hypothetical protein
MGPPANLGLSRPGRARRALGWVAGLVLSTACSTQATHVPPASAPPNAPPEAGAPAESPTPGPGLPVADAGAAVLRSDGEGEYLGVIDRAGLTAIVEQGLGRLLGRLQLSPELEGKRFRGFRVAALDPQWSGSGVLTGDIITRLNGQPIERPEQAMVAFDSLRVASEVAVEIVRDGKPLRLRYRVE